MPHRQRGRKVGRNLLISSSILLLVMHVYITTLLANGPNEWHFHSDTETPQEDVSSTVSLRSWWMSLANVTPKPLVERTVSQDRKEHQSPSDYHQHQQQQQQQHQYLHKNKRGRQVFHSVRAIALKDLPDMLLHMKHDPTFYQRSHPGNKEPILQLLRQAGITQLDPDVVNLLPTQQEIQQLYYSHGKVEGKQEPVVVTIPPNACQQFTQTVPPSERYIGAAGLYNTGTNALTYNLRANLHFPENRRQHYRGILSQVPWHKHTFWNQHRTATIDLYKQVPREHIIPIVMVRDPRTWMESMCRAPYDVSWNEGEANVKAAAKRKCPSWTEPVTLHNQTYRNILQLWNDYYGEYVFGKTSANNTNSTLSTEQSPRIIVRFEDMLFQPQQVVSRIRDCVGATWTHNGTSSFLYVVGSSKWEHVKELKRPQSNWISAMIQHGRADRRQALTDQERFLAGSTVDARLLDMFRYRLDL